MSMSIWKELRAAIKAAMDYPTYGMNCPPGNALPPPPPPKPITTKSMSIDTNKIEAEAESGCDCDGCYSCGSQQVSMEDQYCRDCGARAPGRGVSWDWREQPNWGKINHLLKPFGVVIIELDTNDDQHTIRVGKLK